MLISAKPDIKFRIIHEMLSKDNNVLNITLLCKIAGVSRPGYYYWLKQVNARAKREAKDKADFELILQSYSYRGYAKGVLGIRMRLLRQNPIVVMNPKKIRRLMYKFGLVCPIRKANPYRIAKKMSDEETVADNVLQRKFREFGARHVILTDITYLIKKSNGKWTYLCAFIDAYTKECLSVSLSESLQEDFVLEAAQAVLNNYGNELTNDAIFHSDQGSQFKSNKLTELISNADFRRSMSRKANCWDNAPQESFFGHMKDELTIFDNDTHHNIISKVADWLDYYNNDRPQDSLLMLTPSEYYSYTKTGVYPLAIPIPTPRKYKKTQK